MSLVVNNNMMAANTARNLNAHYGRLATSTQRLSSGLRINSAADDAAGLAIRELQRADIAALHQGARNANDAISLIQVADGSLGIIDEKLIRMKELAEQAATGTYDSTQRLMIESEYQAMASEITRIANATDFNGTKLLDGTLSGDHDGSGLVSEGKLKVHFGTGNDSAEDYYYIEIGECTSQAFGLGNASTWQDVQNRATDAFKTSLEKQIKESNLSSEEKGKLLAQIGTKGEDGTYPEGSALGYINDVINAATDYTQAAEFWNNTDDEGKKWIGSSDLMERYLAAASVGDTAAADPKTEDPADILAAISARIDTDAFDAAIKQAITDKGTGATDLTPTEFKAVADTLIANAKQTAIDNGFTQDEATALETALSNAYTAPAATAITGAADVTGTITALTNVLGGGTAADTAANRIASENAQANQANAEAADAAAAKRDENLKTFWNGLRETEREKLQYAWGQAAIYNLSKGTDVADDIYGTTAPTAFTAVKTGEDADGNDITFNMLNTGLEYVESKVGHMDFAGHTIETQEDAQHALDAINDAIVSKDKIRAHLGATQNRLENTVSNLNIQAENLQAAESRISDVDVATEMTQFVRNQILTQSAVAMLSQANSLPQMAMQLIGG